MKKLIKNHQLSYFTNFGGFSKVHNILISEKLKTFVDTELPKRSGEKMSNIFSNLVLKTIGQINSLSKLSRLKDPLVNLKCCRTNIGRQIDKFSNLSVKILNFFIPKKFLNSNNLTIIIDSTLLKAKGKTYVGNKKLYDHKNNCYYFGYEVCTFILSDGKSFYPYKFLINDESKESILDILKEMKSLFNTNRVSFDAGFKGNDFFEKLDNLGFLFYTKATSNWYFNFGKDYQAKEHLISMQSQKGVYQDRDVFRDNLKLRLVSRKNDKRLILSNDFNLSKKNIFKKYVQRWDVETFFKEAKETFLLQKFIRRKTLNSIISHITIVFASLSILMQLSRKLKIKTKGFQLFIEIFIKFKAIITRKKHKVYVEIENLTEKLTKFFNLRIKFYGVKN